MSSPTAIAGPADARGPRPLTWGMGHLRRVADDPSLRRAIVIVLSLRLLLGLLGWLSLVASPGDPSGTLNQDLLLRPGTVSWALFGAWQRDDALWYERISAHGYSHGGPDNAFFPLFPGLGHVVAAVVGSDLVALLLISTVALVAGLVLVERLALLDLDERVARRAALYLAVSPSAFFLVAPYTESLFLALSVGTLLAARRRHPLLAATLATLASLCRLQGLLLCLPLAWESWVDLRERRARGELVGPSWLAPAAAGTILPAAALATWWSVTRFALDDPGGFTGLLNHYWGIHTVPPWTALTASVQAIPSHPEELFNLGAALLLLAAIPAIWRLRPSYGLYAAASLVVISLRVDDFSPLMSASRYVLMAVHLFLVLADWSSRHPRVRRNLPLLFAAMMAARFVDFAHFHLIG